MRSQREMASLCEQEHSIYMNAFSHKFDVVMFKVEHVPKAPNDVMLHLHHSIEMLHLLCGMHCVSSFITFSRADETIFASIYLISILVFPFASVSVDKKNVDMNFLGLAKNCEARKKIATKEIHTFRSLYSCSRRTHLHIDCIH